MTFTDEDLKRVKEFHIRNEDIMALIARLEAAEKCIPYHECQDDLDTCPHLIAWRKEAGK